jgi:hypothetical protein
MLQDVDTGNPEITLEDMQEFADRKALNIPHAYCDFMAKYNGGRPTPGVFPITGLALNPDGAIQVFFGLGDTEPSVDLEHIFDDLPDSVPKGLFPIACTDGADYVCLDLRRPGAPVVYWDRVPFWGNEVWNENDLYPIAPNFEAFLEALHDPDAPY